MTKGKTLGVINSLADHAITLLTECDVKIHYHDEILDSLIKVRNLIDVERNLNRVEEMGIFKDD